jgi:hypothetical protein
VKNKIQEYDEFLRSVLFKGVDDVDELEHYGDYRLGLTSDEINDYLRIRSCKVGNALKALRKLFNKVAGCNTCAITHSGKVLMYRDDVLRFTNAVLRGTPTFFD